MKKSYRFTKICGCLGWAISKDFASQMFPTSYKAYCYNHLMIKV